MVLSKFLDPKNDYAFKRVFGTEKNKGILIHFLNDILGFKGEDEIQYVKFLQTIQDPDIAYKKQSIVDVLCEDSKKTQYIVEMQVAKVQGFEKRAQYYAAKAYSNQINIGEKYHKLKEVIFIAITNFVMFENKTEFKSDHVTLDKKTLENDLKDFSFTFIELPKFNKSIDELNTIIEKWCYFFKHAEETKETDLTKIVGSDLVIKEAYEELNSLSWTEEERNTYEKELKSDRDFIGIIGAAKEEGEKIGIEKGEINAKVEVAKNLKKIGILIEDIHTATGLTIEELEKL
jgi:predicted transposase/invertase (TIGR01784 family)